MACAFTLTLAYLGEHCGPAETASAFAAYITGNVASNLIGRLIAAAVADHFGLAANFILFAVLNLAGAGLVYVSVGATPPMPRTGLAMSQNSTVAGLVAHLRNPLFARPSRSGFASSLPLLALSPSLTSCWCGPRSGSR